MQYILKTQLKGVLVEDFKHFCYKYDQGLYGCIGVVIKRNKKQMNKRHMKTFEVGEETSNLYI